MSKPSQSPKSQILCYQTHLSKTVCAPANWFRSWRPVEMSSSAHSYSPCGMRFQSGQSLVNTMITGFQLSYLSSPTVTSIVVVPRSRTGVWAQLERRISWLVTQLELGLGHWHLWSLKADFTFTFTFFVREQRRRACTPGTQAHVHTVAPWPRLFTLRRC